MQPDVAMDQPDEAASLAAFFQSRGITIRVGPLRQSIDPASPDSSVSSSSSSPSDDEDSGGDGDDNDTAKAEEEKDNS